MSDRDRGGSAPVYLTIPNTVLTFAVGFFGAMAGLVVAYAAIFGLDEDGGSWIAVSVLVVSLLVGFFTARWERSFMKTKGPTAHMILFVALIALMWLLQPEFLTYPIAE
jgi:uncharacterized membrane protein